MYFTSVRSWSAYCTSFLLSTEFRNKTKFYYPGSCKGRRKQNVLNNVF